MKLQKSCNILELIGNSPLIRLNRMNPHDGVELLLKLESMNPSGSIKDRIALRMIEEAEKSGALTPDKTVLEASSGNTAIGLAMVCAVKGYKILITMSESASEERKKILHAYGADILSTPGHLSTDGAIEEAYRLAREKPDKYVLMDQYNNNANWKAHYDGTAMELWNATGGKINVVVISMGTTGTLMGITRRLKELNPKIRIVGAEPYKGHKIQGLKNMKESYPPGIFNPAEPDTIINIKTDHAYEFARRLAKEEGILVGMSAGAAVRVALDEAKRLGQGTIIAILPDGGERYLSTSLFSSQITVKPLHFYNTLNKKIEHLKPLQPGRVSIYSCGPSMDGPVDLGLCRRVVFSDILRRHLESCGFEVKHVMNIGDIDDRTVNECLKSDLDLQQFTRHWEKEFFDDMDTLKVLHAHNYPRVSDFMNDIIEKTRLLLKKGVAYEKLRSVYFNISQFTKYGKLSNFDLNSIKNRTSIIYDYYEKDNPRDFSLLKRSTLAELKKGIYWDTPWGNVRPGWHIGCSCLAQRFLGNSFDIHTASTDLIFPHGDNEIAIAESAEDSSFAKMWLHSEVVMLHGKKLNRMAGNILTLQDLLSQGYDGITIRYWLLSTHYRKVLKYSEEALNQAKQAVKRLNKFVTNLQFINPQEHNPALDKLINKTESHYHAAMDNDLNIPKALGHVFQFIRKVNHFIINGGMSADQVNKILDFMEKLNKVLDVIDFSEKDTINAGIENLIRERNEARAYNNFNHADSLREKLLFMGIQLFDSPSGTQWKRVEKSAYNQDKRKDIRIDYFA